MLTRDQALQHLHLPQKATREEIEQSYRRLVRRYPPEYHPDRFRLIDESYRTLTSLSFVVETILTDRNQEEEVNLGQRLAELSLTADAEAGTQGVEALRWILLSDALWPQGRSRR
ncbi:MAG: hypothetical protein AB7U29_04445 [Desulfobulbus sp.]